jgi:hypothetical protein
LAIQAGAPVIPVVVANYSDVLYVQSWRFRAGKIPVKGMLFYSLHSYEFWEEHFGLTWRSVETNRDQEPHVRRCGRPRTGYERAYAQRISRADIEERRKANCYAGQK